MRRKVFPGSGRLPGALYALLRERRRRSSSTGLCSGVEAAAAEERGQVGFGEWSSGALGL